MPSFAGEFPKTGLLPWQSVRECSIAAFVTLTDQT
jgi:hypothetical protein